MTDLISGLDWVEDPDGNANSHDGRTIRKDLRDRSDHAIRAIAKRPNDQSAHEIYSIGMERVAYTLARALDLPVMETFLEEYQGQPHSIQLRIPNSRSWIQAGSAPMMTTDIQNLAVYAKAALFDIWMANTDRRDVNLLFEPMPPGTTPGKATSCRLWLIDHGQCGLWPADKFVGLQAHAIPDSPSGMDGEIRPEAEGRIAGLMPVEYRMALRNCQGPDRDQLLDAVRSVGDDAIQHAVMEVPDAYLSNGQREATVAFLQSRLSRLGSVLETYW